MGPLTSSPSPSLLTQDPPHSSTSSPVSVVSPLFLTPLPLPILPTLPLLLPLLLLLLPLLRLPQCPTRWLTWPRRRRRRLRSSQLLTLLRRSPLHPDLLSGLSFQTSLLALEPSQLSPSSLTSCSRTPSSQLTDSLC